MARGEGHTVLTAVRLAALTWAVRHGAERGGAAARQVCTAAAGRAVRVADKAVVSRQLC